MKTAITLTGASVSLLAASMALYAGQVDLSKLPPPSAKKGVTYAKDIKPLFDASCVRCHGGEKPKAGLRLETLEGVLKGSHDGKVVVPGKSEKSLLVIAASRIDEDTAMPPKPKAGMRGGVGGPGDPAAGNSLAGPGAQAGANGPKGSGGPPGGFGPPPKPLTAEEVGLIRAWIDQGAK